MRRISIIAAVLALALFSCAGEKPKVGLPTVVLRSGAIEIVAEVARSQEEQQAGLMFRKELPDGHGMIFVYDSDRLMSFWMKNTYVPLSIAFIAADGTIRTIRDMDPLSEAIVDSGRYVRYALEAPRGWFERVGLKEGDAFQFPAG
ncbi:MAG: DUF192 domain-containing protein, partial [Spirochaetales bacterium]